jgi:alpha-1,6-mannosyltransferase
LADNDPMAIARAVSAIVSLPEGQRRTSARRRAEMFTWRRAALDMLTTLGAASAADERGDSQHTA